MHIFTLEARLSTSLASSAFAPAALLSWQCYGSAHPLRSCCLGLLGRSAQARPLLRRHERLAHTHWVLLKVGGFWQQNPCLHHLLELELTTEQQLYCVLVCTGRIKLLIPLRLAGSKKTEQHHGLHQHGGRNSAGDN